MYLQRTPPAQNNNLIAAPTPTPHTRAVKNGRKTYRTPPELSARHTQKQRTSPPNSPIETLCAYTPVWRARFPVQMGHLPRRAASSGRRKRPRSPAAAAPESRRSQTALAAPTTELCRCRDRRTYAKGWGLVESRTRKEALSLAWGSVGGRAGGHTKPTIIFISLNIRHGFVPSK